jgi:hypothetical protein
MHSSFYEDSSYEVFDNKNTHIEVHTRILVRHPKTKLAHSKSLPNKNEYMRTKTEAKTPFPSELLDFWTLYIVLYSRN